MPPSDSQQGALARGSIHRQSPRGRKKHGAARIPVQAQELQAGAGKQKFPHGSQRKTTDAKLPGQRVKPKLAKVGSFIRGGAVVNYRGEDTRGTNPARWPRVWTCNFLNWRICSLPTERTPTRKSAAAINTRRPLHPSFPGIHQAPPGKGPAPVTHEEEEEALPHKRGISAHTSGVPPPDWWTASG